MVMEEWYDELRMDLHPTTITDYHLYCVPATMLPDQCVPATASVDEEDTVVSDMLGDEPEPQEPCLFSLYAQLHLTR
eukprot:7394508-Pyramimonas_sp.AAC.1